MKLHQHPMSSNARRATMTAHLLEMSLETVFVDLAKGEQRTEEFRELNPNAKIPVLVDGDFVLWESWAIMTYLADKKGATPLYPSEPRARAEVHRWMFWAANQWSPVIATLNWENFVKAMVGGGAPDPARVETASKSFAELAKVLDESLATKPWLTGPAFTLADVSVACSLMTEVPAKLPTKGYPCLARWFSAIKDMPAWKATEPKM